MYSFIPSFYLPTREVKIAAVAMAELLTSYRHNPSQPASMILDPLLQRLIEDIGTTNKDHTSQFRRLELEIIIDRTTVLSL